MVYTLEKLRTYVRSIDNRVKDTVKYPDAWIDERIEKGMGRAQDIKPIFSTKEEYDLYADMVTAELTEVEIIVQLEVSSMHTVECDTNSFAVTVMPNNHVLISRIANTPEPADYSVTIRYFFYPIIPFTEIEMSMIMYRLVENGIAADVYAKLFERELEQYHMNLMREMDVKSAFDIEKDLIDTPDTRLWSGTWA